jgi:hypothetical protein
MLRGFICVAAAVLVSAAGVGADSWPPSRVASFPAPPGAVDVAFEHGPLYALVDGTPPMLFTMDRYNGSITGSFNLQVPAGARGVTYDAYGPEQLWVSNRRNRHIYRLTVTGFLMASFECPEGVPFGLGYSYYNPQHGQGLFATCRNENCIVNVNATTGSLIGTFAGPASAPLEYDDWFCVDRASDYLYWDYNGEWQILDTLPARPWSVATNVLWPIDQWVQVYVLCHDGYIYRYEGYTAVAPASLGRVKALFR